jgi:hypothetical protein
VKSTMRGCGLARRIPVGLFSLLSGPIQAHVPCPHLPPGVPLVLRQKP